MSSSTITGQIRKIALQILDNNPQGVRYSELSRKILEQGNFNKNTISGATWYDTKGNIVFTCSKGLAGVGVDRQDWEKIRNLKAGESYEHTITKSELYKGKKITYHAPFDKCDRVEDYKVAWGHFEKMFNKELYQ